MRIFITLSIALILAQGYSSSLLAQNNDEPLAVLVPGGGTYSRPITTDSELAQRFFDQGLRMAWGFYFPESIASYQEASRLDPDSPMPYFGLAHAAGPNPNSRYANMPDDPQGAGLSAIREALTRINNGSQVERDLVNALFVLYNKDAIPDDQARDQAYLDALRQLKARYPHDADIATLFAEAFMNTSRWDYWDADGNPRSGTAEAQEALETAMRLDHDHPGANHLYIHLMEASAQPELAMPAAQKLEATMPISGHMVHMPGHIYLRVGEYEKAIDINERSQTVDSQFAEIWGDTNLPTIGTYALSHRSHAPHALDFVRYANFLQGNYSEAYAAAKKGADSVGTAEEAVNRGQKRIAHYWVVDKAFGKWEKILSAEQTHDGTPYLDGMWSYVRGSALANTGDLAGAQQALERVQTSAEHPAVDSSGVGPTPASHILELAYYGLQGEMLEASGDLSGAIAAYARAVALQDANNYTEPPDWTQSMRLYLGAALLDAGRAAEAEQVYRKELEWSQQNGWASFGLHQALAAQELSEEAALIKLQFDSYWRNADVTLTRSRI